MILVGYQNVMPGSPVSQIVFNSNINNLNNLYQIMFDSAIAPSSTTQSYLIVQVSSDGGATFQTANYVNSLLPNVTSGFVMGLMYDTGTTNTYRVDGFSYLNNLYWGIGVVTASGTANSFSNPASGAVISSQAIGSAYNGGTINVNAVRIKCSDGSNFSGNFYIYGV